MVSLTMTALMVEGLEKIEKWRVAKITPGEAEESSGELEEASHGPRSSISNKEAATSDSREIEDGKNLSKDGAAKKAHDELSLAKPKIGNPISHSQVIDLSRQLKAHNFTPSRLEDLLKGVGVYVPPPAPRPEPTSEYKALMARLRREEELRAYERMINPPPPMETFNQRFPASPFSMEHAPPKSEDDEVVYADINRQLALVLNVLVSIIACAGAIWVMARWWSTPMRLALSMSGSALVGVAEVVVYAGYIRKVEESKGKEKQIKEVKEIVKTWVVGAEEEDLIIGESASIAIEDKDSPDDVRVRRRKKGS